MIGKRVLIGHCGVDSGQIMITDPCYMIDDGFTEAEYEKVCDITLSEDYAGPLMYEKGHEGKAVALRAGIGDGYYPVYAIYGYIEGFGERILGVEVDFTVHPWLEEVEEEEE
jgi:hypothetical protein